MSFEEEDDEKFIDKILTKQTNRSGNAANPKGKQMSFHPKEMVKGQPVITEEESKSITEWKEMQRIEALFRLRNNMQGHPLNEIKQEGNRLVVDQDKVNARIKHENELLKKMYDEDKKAPKGVKHTVEGKSFLLDGGN